MPAAIEYVQVQAVAAGDVGEELRAGETGGTDLEVRRARAAHRSAAEQRAAKVGAPAARSPHHPARRPLERRVVRVENARFVQNAQRFLPSLHVQLVASRAVERALAVRPWLRVDADVAQQAKRASRHGGLTDVEVQRDLPPASKVHSARRMEEARELGEAIAVRARDDPRELASQVFRE